MLLAWIRPGSPRKSVSDYITPPGVAGDEPDGYGDPIWNTIEVANHDGRAIAESVLVPPQPGITTDLPRAGGSLSPSPDVRETRARRLRRSTTWTKNGPGLVGSRCQCEDTWRDQRRGSREGRCAGNGWPINGQRGGELRFDRGADSHDVCAGEVVRIGDELPLSMEVADRAVVDRGILAIALPRHRSLFRAERGRSMTETGKRVQCRAAQGNDTVEHQAHGQLKLIRALTGQESTTLEVTASCHWIDIAPLKPDRRLKIT
jgi:hypothetical protein